ncbi:MAG: hypothetical protein IJS74_00510 [Clostridia bacterium]|nr:hypothetical protein [Clostridia bacterium]
MIRYIETLQTQLILDYLKNNNYSKAKFCKTYDFPMVSLNNILEKRAFFRMREIMYMAEILNVSLSELLGLN